VLTGLDKEGRRNEKTGEKVKEYKTERKQSRPGEKIKLHVKKLIAHARQ
jgi:hypothetical protein